MVQSNHNKACFQGDYPDPSIVKIEAYYYVVFSSMKYRPALPMFRSKDLIDWEFMGSCLQEFDRDVWAPEIAVINNKLCIYFYAENENWVITCEDINKFSWSTPLSLDIQEYIDPGFLRHENKNYLFLGKGMMCELSEDGLKRTSPLRKVFPDFVVDNDEDIEGDFIESPKLMVYQDMIYYTVTTGGTAGPATGHRVLSARSKSVEGPWEFSPYNPIIVAKDRSDDWHCQGHATIFEADDGWYSIYHAYQKDAFLWGRQCLIEKIEWDNHGWFYRTHQCIAGKEKTFVQLQNEFVSFKEQAKVETIENGFRLYAKGNTIGNSEKLLFPLAKNSFELECDLSVLKDTVAGITMFYNEEHCIGIGIETNKIKIIRHNELLNEISCDQLVRKIKISVKNFYWKSYVSYDGETFVKINNVIDISTFNHNSYGGFMSLRPGFFCYGKQGVEFSNLKLSWGE